MKEIYISEDLQEYRQHINASLENPGAWRTWQIVHDINKARVTDPEGKIKGFLIYSGKLESVKNWIKLDK